MPARGDAKAAEVAYPHSALNHHPAEVSRRLENHEKEKWERALPDLSFFFVFSFFRALVIPKKTAKASGPVY
jgi:hypothetical protein